MVRLILISAVFFGMSELASAQTEPFIFPEAPRATVNGDQYAVVPFAYLEREIGASIRFNEQSPFLGANVAFIARIGLKDHANMVAKWNSRVNIVARTPAGLSEPLRETVFLIDDAEQPFTFDYMGYAGLSIRASFFMLATTSQAYNEHDAIIKHRVLSEVGILSDSLNEYECQFYKFSHTTNCLFVVFGHIARGPRNVDAFAVEVNGVHFYRYARHQEGAPLNSREIYDLVLQAAAAL